MGEEYCIYCGAELDEEEQIVGFCSICQLELSKLILEQETGNQEAA